VLHAPTGALEEAAATWPLQNSALATFPDGPSANLGLLVVFLLWKVPFHFDVKIKDPELFLVPRHRPLGRVDGYLQQSMQVPMPLTCEPSSQEMRSGSGLTAWLLR
jgi:hypothetical protein